jgi:imidazolonepropionase
MPRFPADFLIDRADLIATCAGPAPRRGAAQGDVSSIPDAAIASFRGRIVYAGPRRDLHHHVDLARDAVSIDASGCTVTPGFVDAHTHLVYAGDRRDEIRRRLAGATYAEIAAAGGGILKTVEATRAASLEELVGAALPRLDDMAACGTTTCEVKSGYGLTVESELRQLQAVKLLAEQHPLDLVPTFLGAHEVPIEYRTAPDDYVSLVINEMIPRVAEAGLAEWCDVFCEAGAFTPSQSAAILTAGARAGLTPRIHADELGPTGGSGVAAHVGARSADHLVFVDEHGIDALARASVCAVLLPIAALYLKLGRYAPARALIEAGVPVAFGTDMNPGAGLSPSMPFAMALGCFAMGMTLEESLVAATLNAAWSLDRADSVGSLEPGKLMDAVILGGGLTELIRVNAGAIRTVVKAGRVIVGG